MNTTLLSIITIIVMTMPLFGQNTAPWPATGNIGMGTDSPASQLDVYASDSSVIAGFTGNNTSYTGIALENEADVAGGDIQLMFRQAGATLWSIGNEGTTGHLVIGRGPGEFGTHDALQIDPAGNVALGDVFATGYRLSVTGKIICEELKVENSGEWPDFVFRDEYRLMPLRSLEKYITTHHRLPNIPSAEEVDLKGVDVGQMQARLLQKVEELTLYVIGLKNENETLKKRLDSLEN